MSTMLEQLRQLACRELGLTDDELDSHATFAALGLDSLMLVDFMFAIEDHFHIEIDHDQAMKDPTLAGLATLVQSLVDAKAGADAGAAPLAA